MSHGGGPLSVLGPIGQVLLIIAGFFVLWYLTGGPQRAQVDGNDPFMKPLAPLDSGTTYGPNTHTR